MFPVTTLTELSKSEKQQLMNKGIVLCRQVVGNPKVLQDVGVSKSKQAKVLAEANELCKEK
jgi:hypothetical protein